MNEIEPMTVGREEMLAQFQPRDLDDRVRHIDAFEEGETVYVKLNRQTFIAAVAALRAQGGQADVRQDVIDQITFGFQKGWSPSDIADEIMRALASQAPSEARMDHRTSDPGASIEEIRSLIWIEFPGQTSEGQRAAERIHNLLLARAKTLARRTTASGLPHCEGQAVECDGGSRSPSEASGGVGPFGWYSTYRAPDRDDFTRNSHLAQDWRDQGQVLIPLYASPPPSASQASCSPPESDACATIEEIRRLIWIEFPGRTPEGQRAAERIHNLLLARHGRAKTLAQRATASGLPHREGQAVECDGGSRSLPRRSNRHERY